MILNTAHEKGIPMFMVSLTPRMFSADNHEWFFLPDEEDSSAVIDFIFHIFISFHFSISFIHTVVTASLELKCNLKCRVQFRYVDSNSAS